MICQTRRPRRFCPGVGGDICSLCCGTERENTVDCPLDCEYLQESRQRERPEPLDPAQMPHADIRVSDEFMERNRTLIGFLTQALAEAGVGTRGAIDLDVREALDALVRTYRTRESGLYYDTRPANPIAAQVGDYISKVLEGLQRDLAQRSPGTVVRDADVLGSLVFLARLEVQLNNGRRRGRAFIDFLRANSPEPLKAPPASSSGLVLPA